MLFIVWLLVFAAVYYEKRQLAESTYPLLPQGHAYLIQGYQIMVCKYDFSYAENSEFMSLFITTALSDREDDLIEVVRVF